MIYIDLNMSPEVETRDLARSPFRIGDWLIEPSLNRISRGEETIQFELKWMDALVCLAERAGEVVSRIEIIDRVWATEFITDNTLTHTIAEIRNALGDDAKKPTFVETIHRRGYRLIAPVKPVLSEQDAESKVTKFPVPLGPFPVDDERSPYPGLAAFTEAEAEFFFGREAEVAKMWRKLTSRRLLAVIGPSGVGKSSFLRAGVIPAKPEGWGVLVCQPGEAPLSALATALLPEFVDDLDAGALLVGPHEADRLVTLVARWRERHDQALLVVDQFEELFTQNPPEAQAGFADLLRKLVDNSDVHILLSMRDDFLYRCHGHEPVRPIFEDLTALEQPSSESLRRALVEPARRLGFAFEDTDLPGEMVAEVESERGALPLLAFAVACLWDTRDREGLVLTRQAYNDIGGVGGALARHAEATIDRIGTDRIAVVRELFRNLVTAEGTRAVREWEELLSVFHGGDPGAGLKPAPTREMAAAEKRTVGAGFTPAREAAEEVLRELIDARLLTSYEVHEEGEEPTRRIEIIHESLLANWPRLVGWQTQDADSTRLRDELRQAARTWDEHDRSDELLWTGSVYREFTVWRERYPGGLSELEEAFAAAMTSLAKRRKRRRRMAAATALVLAVVLASVFGILWRRSVLETRRAEAAKLLALAQVELDTDPTEALAYATSSLELADTYEARIFATRALWAGPPVRALDLQQFSDAQFMTNLFSPDGRWLAVAGLVTEDVLVFGEDGGQPIALGGHAVSAANAIDCAWTDNGLLVTGHWTEGRVRLWDFPGGRLVRTIEFEDETYWVVGDTDLLAEAGPGTRGQPGPTKLLKWKLPNGEAEHLGWFDLGSLAVRNSCFDPSGKYWLYSKDDSVYSRPLPVSDETRDTLIARHSSDGSWVRTWRRPEGVYSSDSGGEIILWTTPDGTSVSGRRLRKPETATGRLLSEPSGRWAFDQSDDNRLRLWDRSGMTAANPWVLRRHGAWVLSYTDFDPHGNWVIATTNNRFEVSFWPLAWPRPFVADGWGAYEFTPDGRCLLSSDLNPGTGDWVTQLRLWPLPGTESPEVVDLMLPANVGRRCMGVKVDAKGERAVTKGYGQYVFVIPLSGEEPRQFEGFPGSDVVRAVGFSPSGRLAAAASTISDGQAKLRVWNLETDEMMVFDQPKDAQGYKGYYAQELLFVDESTLYTAGANGLLRWDIGSGTYEQLRRAPAGGFLQIHMTSDRRKMFVYEEGSSWPREGPIDLHDLRTGDVRSLDIPKGGYTTLSSDGTVWASVEEDGLIWVGQTEGGEPHLLLGHEGGVSEIAISQDLRWVASSGADGTLRLWPMPDLSKPPLHTLPREELIAKLKTLTNLRVVRDEESTSGWKLEVGPFPGWETVPSW